MKRKLILGLLLLALVALPLCAACQGEGTTTGDGTTTDGGTTTGDGDWWTEFGEPQYGGTITIAESVDTVSFDPTIATSRFSQLGFMFPLETLFQWNWTVDRDTWSFPGDFAYPEYFQGLLAESWEQTDLQTVTIHLREGIHWQDTPPLNGRELVAADVVEHYQRMMGTDGYEAPTTTMYAPNLNIVEDVYATDDYTVVFKFLEPTATGIFTLLDTCGLNAIEAPESVSASGGAITSWEDCVGTGPWIVTDYAAGTSITFSRNPDYWGTDSRYPENQLPYADTFKILNISEPSTILAALRSGQIDITTIVSISWQQAESMAETDPDLMQASLITSAANFYPREDSAPFNDIRVRKAMQLAINLEEIAESYFGGNVDATPCGMVSPSYVGWAYAYEDWPEELKEEYEFNPDLAMELLADAAADGVFEPNDLGGFDTGVIAPNDEDLQLLQVIQSYFLDIGIDMEITPMDSTTAFNMCLEGNNDQLYYSMHGAMLFSPSIYLGSHVSESFKNFSHCSDPLYDDAFARFNSATTTDEARQAVQDADKQVITEHWDITLLPTPYFVLYQPYLMGYSGEAMNTMGSLRMFTQLWVDQDLKTSMGR